MNSYALLSEDERLLKASAHATVAGTEPTKIWQSITEQGWLGTLVPAEEGGFGGSAVDLLILCEALGSKMLGARFLSSSLAISLLCSSTARSRATLLREAASGRRKYAVAHAESSRDPEGRLLDTRATEQRDVYRLTGAKRLVLFGADADSLLVSAALDDGTRDCFVVPRSGHGVRSRTYTLIDGTDAADIFFEDAIAEERLAIGSFLEEGILTGAFLASCEAIGCLQSSLDMTIAHLLTREQFGSPLATFQVLRHRVADMYCTLEELRSLAFVAARASPGSERIESIRTTKAYLGLYGVWAAEQAVQLHGAMGITSECMVGQILTRITVLDRLYGGADHHIARLGERLCAETSN